MLLPPLAVTLVPIAVLPLIVAFALLPPATALPAAVEPPLFPNSPKVTAIAGVTMPRVSAEISAIDRDLKPDLVLT